MKDNARKIIRNVIEENAVALKAITSTALYTKMNDRLKQEYVKVSKSLFDKKKLNESAEGVQAAGIIPPIVIPEFPGGPFTPDSTAPGGVPTGPSTPPPPTQPPQQPNPPKLPKLPPGARPFPGNPRPGQIHNPGKGPNYEWDPDNGWVVIPTPSRVSNPRSPRLKPQRGSGSGAPPR